MVVSAEKCETLTGEGNTVIFTGRSNEKGSEILKESVSDRSVFYRLDQSIPSDVLKFSDWI